MLTDSVVISLLLALSWSIGRSALRIMGGADDLKTLSIPVGISLALIAVNLLYFIGDLKISSIRNVLLACFILSGLYFAKKFQDGTREDITDLLSTVGIYAILVLPAIIGGEQYYVFRGNWWDHFTYLTAAYGFANHPLSSVTNFDIATLLSNEMLIFAKEHYNSRPSVMLLFSLFLADGHGDIFFRGFLYNSALLAAVFPSLLLIFRKIQDSADFKDIPQWLLSLLPAGYILGFWGQYIFDINAWGQLASLSLSLAFIASCITLLHHWFSPAQTKPSPTVPHYTVTVILFSGTWFIYPENALFHLVMVVVATASWLVYRRPVMTIRTIAWMVALPLFSLLFALPNYQTTISFILTQAADGLTKVKDWWIYFDAYLAGIDTPFPDLINAVFMSPDSSSALQNLVSGFWYVPFYSVTSFFGLYFITPRNDAGLFLFPWQMGVIIFSLSILFTFLNSLLGRFRQAGMPVFFLRLLCITGLLMTAYLAFKFQWWSAGKALLYTSPFLYILLMLPLLQQSRTPGRKPVQLLTTAVAATALVFSLGFGAARIYASTDAHGIGYYRNYPSIQGMENKQNINWRFDIEAAKGCGGVNLDRISHPFFLHYAKLKLAYAGIPYFTHRPVYSYLGQGDPIGTMPTIATDCFISPQFDHKGRFAVSVQKY